MKKIKLISARKAAFISGVSSLDIGAKEYTQIVAPPSEQDLSLSGVWASTGDYLRAVLQKESKHLAKDGK